MYDDRSVVRNGGGTEVFIIVCTCSPEFSSFFTIYNLIPLTVLVVHRAKTFLVPRSGRIDMDERPDSRETDL